MNFGMISGNVVKDPETRTTKTGKQVCTFSVAVNKKINGEKTATFFQVIAWEGLADICGRFVKKGMRVNAYGEIALNEYTTQTGEKRASLQIRAQNVEMCNRVEKKDDDDLPF